MLYSMLQRALLPISGDWTSGMRAALSRARSAAMTGAPAENLQTCIVWEVARKRDKGWICPFWPTELEQQQRWMDDGLYRRHPLLDPTVDYQHAEEPPIVMLPIWVPTTPWRKDIQALAGVTDSDGWQYGTSWRQTGEWRTYPRPMVGRVFDQVRRRRWLRCYQLDATQGNIPHVDASVIAGSQLMVRPFSYVIDEGGSHRPGSCNDRCSARWSQCVRTCGVM